MSNESKPKRPNLEGRLVVQECIVRKCANCGADATHTVVYYDNTYQYDPYGKHRLSSAFEWSCTKCIISVTAKVLKKEGVGD